MPVEYNITMRHNNTTTKKLKFSNLSTPSKQDCIVVEKVPFPNLTQILLFFEKKEHLHVRNCCPFLVNISEKNGKELKNVECYTLHHKKPECAAILNAYVILLYLVKKVILNSP
jgi:hypothetical protein